MSARLTPRWAVVALMTAVVGLVGIPALSSVASASASLPALPAGYVVTPVPSNGAFAITGRSWGHRIGLSQVGAQYAGRAGFSAPAILAHYYPGTTLSLVGSVTWPAVWPGTPPNSTRPLLRVYVEANSGASLVVTAAPTLRVATPNGQQFSLPSVAALRWRFVSVNSVHPTYGLTLQYAATGTTWRTVSSPWPLGSSFASTGGVRVELAGGTTRTEPSAVALTTTKVGSRSWITVSRVDPEVYLAAVVASEIGPSSAPATLQAQAIAARSYAARLASLYGASRNYDVCAATCQYYPGIATGTVAAGRARDKLRAYDSTSAAVGATRDRILTYRGAPALTMFAASNGGYTRSGGQAYLPAQPDPWDALSKSSSHAWSASIPTRVLAAFIPSGDRLTALALGGRDGLGDLGGTASVVVLDSVSPTGVAHRSTITPAALRSAWGWPTATTGLRSTWFAVVAAAIPTPPPTPTPAPTPAPPPVSSPKPTTPPATGSTGLRPAVLHRGMRGPAVLALQRVLGSAATGRFGPSTQAYVSRWQTRHHIRPTGYVDHALYVRLRLPTALLPH
jgi:peptidoglycan hydrolase-like amidase